MSTVSKPGLGTKSPDSILAFVAMWLMGCAANGQAAKEPESPGDGLALVDATIVDVTNGSIHSGMTVVVHGNRIRQVGANATTPVPAGFTRVDVHGGYLIPGLWDFHAHSDSDQVTRQIFFPVLIANGVTGVRDMFADSYPATPGVESDSKEVVDRWRSEIAAHVLVGPRIVASSALVDGPKPLWPGSMPVSSADDGRRAAQYVVTRGNDFLKVYSLVPREAYLTMATEAKQLGLVFAGHVPESISAVEASDAGQKSIEHLSGVLFSCSREEARLREARDATKTLERYSEAWWTRRREIGRELISSYDEPLAKSVFACFIRNGTWQCPTLAVLRASAWLDDTTPPADERARYIPRGLTEDWAPSRDPRFEHRVAADLAIAKQTFAKQMRLVGEMHAAGVGILAGSDYPNPNVYPGFSLHDELALLVDAGLTPLEALQCATLNPARYLGGRSGAGTLAEGELADIVVLEANPLVDIHNTRKIAAVVADGRYFSKQALTRLLAAAEQAIADGVGSEASE